MSTEHILVHDNILEAFTVELKKAVSAMFGESTPAQPMALSTGIAKVAHLGQDATSKGAVLIEGQLSDSFSSASSVAANTANTPRPFVLGDVSRDMDIYHNESFGSCVSIISFNDDEEAIQIANDTEFGLSGAVFTRDLGKGLSIARRMETGAVHVNGMSVHDEAGLPHGGVKNRGWGRFNADAGLNEFLTTKTITFRAAE
jgi:acyl-CoA reductase-like NAD-dependent aldehyde dehydrogenase